MKYHTLKLAVLSALSITSTQIMADWVSLSPTGYPVAAGFNYTGSPAGTTAYTLCNPTGDFGEAFTTPPTSIANACYVTPNGSSPVETSPPDASYTGLSAFPIASATRPIVVNNTYTGGVNKTVGSMQEYVWRKSTGSGSYQCIYGTKFVMTTAATADYLPDPGMDYFEINDFSRGGFGGNPVDIGYWRVSAYSGGVYRAGYTYTAVQHRSSALVPEFAELPLTTPTFAGTINGVDTTPLTTVPTTAQQSASINTNWIDFTTKVYIPDSSASSSMMYIRTACTAAAPVALANAVRVRQTNRNGGHFIEATLSGFVPAGGTIGAAETHSDPY